MTMEQFREMRRKRQELLPQECVEVLRRATSGTLAVLGDNGYPYAVPLSYVYDNGLLYFHSALTGHKVDAIRRCDKASFCVVDRDDVKAGEYTTYYRSVIAFGRVRVVEDERQRLVAARLLGNRYNPGHDAALEKELERGLSHMLVLSFDIRHLTGKQAIELVGKGSRQD